MNPRSDTEAATLEARGLVVGYGRTAVAGPLDCRFLAGRVHALTGSNGCGKTTLVRTLLGLQRPLLGTVLRPSVTLSYVPQIGTFDTGFPLTVEEVLATGMRARHIARSERRERTLRALRSVGLEETRCAPFFSLSGGQRQRVLVARAFMAQASIVALDEPTAGVDPKAATAVWSLLARLAHDAGCLILTVTHDVWMLPEYADVVWLLSEGGLSPRGAPGV